MEHSSAFFEGPMPTADLEAPFEAMATEPMHAASTPPTWRSVAQRRALRRPAVFARGGDRWRVIARVHLCR